MFDLPLHLILVILYIVCVCYIPYAYFDPYKFGQGPYAFTYMGTHAHMGWPYAYRIDLLNFKFIHDLAYSWIKEHLAKST